MTYKEFGRQVDAARAGLAALGVGRGDVVGCISANRAEWAVCAYATYSLGGAFVPMYEEQLVKDWRYIVENSGAKVLFVSTEVRTRARQTAPHACGGVFLWRCTPRTAAIKALALR
jgi:long-chain acyl-CoA synthetase